MSLRRDPDQLITAWVADSVGIGGPDYLSEVLAVVERTPQQRWAKWFPGGWTVAQERLRSFAAGCSWRRLPCCSFALVASALACRRLPSSGLRPPGCRPLAGVI